MALGVVTGFTHNGRDYELPLSDDQRKRFTRELVRELKSLGGVSNVFHAGSSHTGESIRLEIEVEFRDDEWLSYYALDANPRSLSPRIRNTFEDFVLVSNYEVLTTPDAHDADRNQYESALYIAEAWFF